MKTYYEKRPKYYVFTYEETEVLPTEVVTLLVRMGYAFHIKIYQHEKDSRVFVDRVLVIRKIATHGNTEEYEVGNGESIMIDPETKRVFRINTSYLINGFEEVVVPNTL